MKLSSWRALSFLSVALLVASCSAQNPNNPIQIALLRWYQANTVAQFATCSGPQGLAFDGSHMWVSCIGSDGIEEFNSSDGALVGSVTLSSVPYFLVYDGANIWASNPSAGTVTKIQASTRTVLATVTVGTNPMGMAFDGTYVWVANSGSNNLTKILASSATVAATYTFSPAGCSAPMTIAYDGTHTYMWVVCNAAPSGPGVVAVGPTGTEVTGTPITLGTSPYCNVMAFDGTNVWISNSGSNSAIRINTSTLTKTTFSLSGLSSNPAGVAFDSLYIWVVDTGSSTVSKLTTSGTLVGTYSTPSSPNFIAFDGGNIWIANGNAASVSKF